MKITLRALAINPKQQLMIQVELTDEKLPLTGLTVDAVSPNSAGSAFFAPLRVRETSEIYLSLSDGWHSATPPYAAVIAIIRSDGSAAPIQFGY